MSHNFSFLQRIISHDLRFKKKKNPLGRMSSLVNSIGGKENSLNNSMRYKLWTSAIVLIAPPLFVVNGSYRTSNWFISRYLEFAWFTFVQYECNCNLIN